MANSTTLNWMFAWSAREKLKMVAAVKITFSDLQGAEKITVGNALRGEIEAVLNH